MAKWIEKTPNGRWKARLSITGRGTRNKTFDRKLDAKRWLTENQAQLDRGTWIDPSAGKLPLQDVADMWLETGSDKAQSTQDRDRSYLRSLILPQFGGRPIKTIRTSDIERWLARLDRSPNTKTKALQIVNGVFELARRDHLIASNPAADVSAHGTKPVKEARALSDEEVQRILNAAEEVDERTAPLVWLMVSAGLRIGEALALKRSDLDLQRGTLRVAQSMSRSEGLKHPKTRASARTIPTPPDLAERLKRHFTETSMASLDGYVVTAPSGGPIHYSNWRQRIWRRIIDVAGVEGAVPHWLRHTALTRLFVVDRWTPAEVQAFAGHEDPRTTLAIYTHVEAHELPRPSAMPGVASNT